MAADEAAGSSSTSTWSREEDKAFEDAIATYPEDSSDRWEKIAADLPGKTLEEIKLHYEVLVDDISNIESGSVPLPQYSNPEGSKNDASDEEEGKKGAENSNSESNHKGKGSRSDQERRKGIAWTEEEHRLFLLGLDKYGKGDWRSISRNFVVTRTPTQVASHAQKYFIRLNSMNKDRRRSSIHDITSVSDNPDIATPPGPITGQTNGAPSAPGASSGKPVKPAATGSAVGGVYGGQTIGQPVGGPIMSTVGTPVNLPASGHVAYGVRAPVPGAPMMAYPVPQPHAPAHR